MTSLCIDTPRLRLLELEDGDAPFVVELLNSEGFLRHIGDRGVRTTEGALRYIAEGPRASYAAHGFGLWKAQRKSDGVLVGMSGLLQRDYLPQPDLGYAFLPQFQGQGYASEAGAAVLQHGFTARGMDRILAIVSPDNAGSARVLEKLGMADEGLRDVDGKTLRVYSIARP